MDFWVVEFTQLFLITEIPKGGVPNKTRNSSDRAPPPLPNQGQNMNQDKTLTNLTRSQWGFVVKWPFTHDQTDMTNLFSECVPAMSSIQLVKIFRLSF